MYRNIFFFREHKRNITHQESLFDSAVILEGSCSTEFVGNAELSLLSKPASNANV